MNETDFIRQQLALERAHLRVILQAVHQASGAARPARAVQLYLDWAGLRLWHQIAAHRTALQSAALDPDAHQRLAGVDAALASTSQGTHLSAVSVLGLLEAWSEPLDALAARTLRVTHWRQAAQLNADAILEERQRYVAARGAAGLA